MVNAASIAAPLPLAGEGWGERGDIPCENGAFTRLAPARKCAAERVGFSRQRERRSQLRQLAAAAVTVSRWRFMTILLSAPR
ncbi:hypothetical protein SAMN05216338_1001376 [Bradyrhizobium sp. Rc2d]|nr:hypothetical protein SAMN05216338_1001376 [Bradyrhizobium sp. Rc2d]